MLKQKKNSHNSAFIFYIIMLFLCDTLTFYTTHYAILYTTSYALLLQLFYSPYSNKRWFILCATIVEFCFTIHAPHLALMLFFFYKKIAAACNTYLYHSPSIPFALCAVGWSIITMTIKIYTSHWPFPHDMAFVIKALCANAVAIFALPMLYSYYGKQGNR